MLNSIYGAGATNFLATRFSVEADNGQDAPELNLTFQNLDVTQLTGTNILEANATSMEEMLANNVTTNDVTCSTLTYEEMNVTTLTGTATVTESASISSLAFNNAPGLLQTQYFPNTSCAYNDYVMGTIATNENDYVYNLPLPTDPNGGMTIRCIFSALQLCSISLQNLAGVNQTNTKYSWCLLSADSINGTLANAGKATGAVFLAPVNATYILFFFLAAPVTEQLRFYFQNASGETGSYSCCFSYYNKF
jgi:hypothetical protein